MRIMHVALLQTKARKQGAAALTMQLAVADNPTFVVVMMMTVMMMK